jgi:hypothetical protein
VNKQERQAVETLLHELLSRVLANPDRKLAIIQEFYSKQVADGHRERANIVLIAKALVEAGSDETPGAPAQIQIGAVYMDSKYKNVGGNVGAMGDNAQAHDFTQVANQSAEPIDFAALSQQLSLLRTKLKEEARIEEEAGRDASHYDIAIGSIAAAKTAADKGEEPGVLQHLVSAGKWVADFASKVGASLVSELIKKQLGM